MCVFVSGVLPYQLGLDLLQERDGHFRGRNRERDEKEARMKNIPEERERVQRERTACQ